MNMNNRNMGRNPSCPDETRTSEAVRPSGTTAGMSARAACGMQPACGPQPVRMMQPVQTMQSAQTMQPAHPMQSSPLTQEGAYAGNMRMRQPMQGGRGANQTRCSLMRQINESSFAMDDAQLFLDTHPDSMAAMQYFRNAAAMRQNAMDAYQRQFGPLMAEETTGNEWNWTAEPWPWEGGI